LGDVLARSGVSASAPVSSAPSSSALGWLANERSACEAELLPSAERWPSL
jgi:hypothetical protein